MQYTFDINCTIAPIKNMKALKEEYQIQVRNTVMSFLHTELELSVTDLSAIFKLDKGTVSRALKNTEGVDKGLIIRLAKAFKR